ncbi:MAG: cobalamin biosynthesis protein [Lachnospiraceae bacterium]|nr:cobalamin biosynthesis protein [Lachnospiraceae bacterium]
MTLSIICFTEAGYELEKKINNALAKTKTAYIIKKYVKCKSMRDRLEAGFSYVDEGISDWSKRQFEDRCALIFIGATGIAVRAIAGCVESKLTDSPVIVMDEQGRFIVPLLSGHVGGANELSKRLADITGAVLVMTTATDIRNEFAIDLFAKNNKLNIVNKDRIADVTSKLLDGQEIVIAVPKEALSQEALSQYAEYPYNDKVRLVGYDIYGEDDIVVRLLDEDKISNCDIDVFVFDIGYKNLFFNKGNIAEKITEDNCLLLEIKEYVIGIGCKKGKTYKEINDAIMTCLLTYNIEPNQVAYIASIDVKKDEADIIEFADKHRISYITFSAEELADIEGDFAESDFVREQVGVGNVCERAAMAACRYGGTLIQGKESFDGITIAIAKRNWRVSFDET